MSNLEIHVLNNQEEPLRGIEVVAAYTGRGYGDADRGRFYYVYEGWAGEARTDKEGYVHFNDFKGRLYLNGKFAGRSHISGVSITIIMGRRVKYDDEQSSWGEG